MEAYPQIFVQCKEELIGVLLLLLAIYTLHLSILTVLALDLSRAKKSSLTNRLNDLQNDIQTFN